MVLEYPLFQGKNSVDQIVEIIKICGIPSKNFIKSMNKNYKYINFLQLIVLHYMKFLRIILNI